MPLLIKAPGQKKGKVDDAWVETIDILPTIFDVLNLDPRVKMDGKSASRDEVQNRDELRMLMRNSFEELRIPAEQFERERQAILDRNHALLGTGADGPERIYGIGPHQELIGQPPRRPGCSRSTSTSPTRRNTRRRSGRAASSRRHVVGRVRAAATAAATSRWR